MTPTWTFATERAGWAACGHPIYGIDEIRGLLDLRTSERLTFKQVSERSGVPIHVLTYRAKRDGSTPRAKPPEASAFVELVAESSSVAQSAPATSSGIELQFPGGLRAQLARNFDEATLLRLLSLSRC